MITRLVISFCLMLILSSCIPKAVKPAGDKQNFVLLENAALNTDRIKAASFTIQANRPWQNSGIFVENGNILQISASGKWSIWPASGVWTGPEGTRLWGNKHHGGALIARIGHDSQHFETGVTQTVRAQGYGMLYFRINDADENLFDNQGEIEAQVYIGGSSQQSEQTAANIRVVAYEYNDAARKGSLSASSDSDQFALRNWMLSKIGEIASSKHVAIRAGHEPIKGGNYTVLDESMADGVMTIEFNAVW